MKNLSLLFIAVMLLGAGACKKASHENLTCGTHKHVANNNCVCDNGWSGANCDVASLCDSVICLAHAHCVSGICQCDSGWTGANCDTAINCLNINCGLHGHCASGVCVCDSGWSGANCDVSCANVNCGTHGHCVSGACVCDPGWAGVNCDISTACANVNCGFYGHCVSGTCVCDSFWTGTNCQNYNPCLYTTCGTHQHCVSGTCVCDAGWVGANCDVTIDTFPGNYQMSGTCHKWSYGQYDTTYTVDNIIVTKIDDSSLRANLEPYNVSYDLTPSVDYFAYVWDYSTDVYIHLFFPKQAIDSLYYYDRFASGHTTGNECNLQGIKIH